MSTVWKTLVQTPGGSLSFVPGVRAFLVVSRTAKTALAHERLGERSIPPLAFLWTPPCTGKTDRKSKNEARTRAFSPCGMEALIVICPEARIIARDHRQNVVISLWRQEAWVVIWLAFFRTKMQPLMEAEHEQRQRGRPTEPIVTGYLLGEDSTVLCGSTVVSSGEGVRCGSGSAPEQIERMATLMTLPAEEAQFRHTLIHASGTLPTPLVRARIILESHAHPGLCDRQIAIIVSTSAGTIHAWRWRARANANAHQPHSPEGVAFFSLVDFHPWRNGS